MDMMGVLNLVITGLVVVMVALVLLMFVTMLVTKVLSFGQTFSKIGKAKKEAEKASAAH